MYKYWTVVLGSEIPLQAAGTAALLIIDTKKIRGKKMRNYMRNEKWMGMKLVLFRCEIVPNFTKPAVT